MLLQKVQYLRVPVIPEERGNLSFLQNSEQVPFDIKRVYWINSIRGSHCGQAYANIESNELIIALSGSFDVIISDGVEERLYTLNRPDTCLCIPPMTWRKLDNFSTNSVALIAADRLYCEEEKMIDFSAYQMHCQYA